MAHSDEPDRSGPLKEKRLSLGDARIHRAQSLVAYATLALVLLSVLVLGGYSPLAWSLLSISVLLLFSLQVGLAFTSSVPLAVSRLALPGLLFLAALGWAWIQTLGGIPDKYAHPLWAYVSDAPAAISADPGQGMHAVMRLLCYAMIFVITVWASVDARRASRMLKAIAVFSTVLAGYSIFGFDVAENLYQGEYAGTSIVNSTFVNRNHYATYAVFGALANLAAYHHVSMWRSDDLRRRVEGFFSGEWIYLFGVLLCIGAVSLTQSRAGGVSGLIGLATFLLVWRRNHVSLWNSVMLVFLLAALVFFAFTSAAGLADRLFATSNEDSRFTVYPAIVQAIADRPVLGHGLGAFHDAFRAYVPRDVSGVEWTFAHNIYLEIAFGLGLAAAGVFFTALALIALRIQHGARTRRSNRVYTCFALGCVTTAAFHSVFDFSLQMPAVAALFAVILGMGYAQSFTHRDTAAFLDGKTDGDRKRASRRLRKSDEPAASRPL